MGGIEYAIGLRGLTLADNQVRDISPLRPGTDGDDHPVGAAQLQWLDLAGNDVADLAAIERLDRMQWSNVDRNRVTSLEPLAGLENLELLSAVYQSAPGLVGEYYLIDSDDPAYPLTDFPDFDAREPTHTQVDGGIDINVGTNEFQGLNGFKDNFGVRWTGQIYVPEAGDYTFCLTSDDGSRLTIEGLFLDNGGLHGSRTESETVTLDAGRHDLRVEFFERGGGRGEA